VKKTLVKNQKLRHFSEVGLVFERWQGRQAVVLLLLPSVREREIGVVVLGGPLQTTLVQTKIFRWFGNDQPPL